MRSAGRQSTEPPEWGRPSGLTPEYKVGLAPLVSVGQKQFNFHTSDFRVSTVCSFTMASPFYRQEYGLASLYYYPLTREVY